MKKIHISTSTLTGTIYAGSILKDGCTWAADKQDVTMKALKAVAVHALQVKNKTGEPIIINTEDGKPLYKISVTDLTKLKTVK